MMLVDRSVVAVEEEVPAPVASQFKVAVVVVPDGAAGEYEYDSGRKLAAATLDKGEDVGGAVIVKASTAI